MFARSGWRVNAGDCLADRFRAVPRTNTPRRGPDPQPNPPRNAHPHQTRTGAAGITHPHPHRTPHKRRRHPAQPPQAPRAAAAAHRLR
ncbi:hypothetical protein RGQ21_35690 [Kitasatospora aureofaciens]|nr:hypothetical protein RGQ21_35690 [Kitasatospora aureofaciens]